MLIRRVSASAEDAYDGSSEASTDSAESVKILIPSPVKRPCVPSSWQIKFADLPGWKASETAPLSQDEKPVLVQDIKETSDITAQREKPDTSTHLQGDEENSVDEAEYYVPNMPVEKKVNLSGSTATGKVVEDCISAPASPAAKSVTDPVVISETAERPYERAILFPASGRPSPLLKTTILKLSNLPFEITVDELLDWLGEDIKQALPDSALQIVSVHILCQRFTGRTKQPAYVEVIDRKIANKVKSEKYGTLLKGRGVKIEFATRRAMLCDVRLSSYEATVAADVHDRSSRHGPKLIYRSGMAYRFYRATRRAAFSSCAS